MANFSGSVTINGINDAELVTILEIKMRHEKSLNFNPQQLQPAAISPGVAGYNNAILHWNSEEGLEAVRQIILTLLKKEEPEKKAA
jgi:hypothetical protein